MASRRISRRGIVGAVAVVAVVGAGTSAWALSGSSAASYRTAVVSRGAVSQELTTTGTITPVRDADLDFQVAGTVAKMMAKQGHQVSAGQRVAVLDRGSLTAAVRSAQSTLDNARAQLVSDANSQAAAASTPSDSGATTPTPTPSATKGPKASPSPTAPTGTDAVDKQLLAKIHRDQTTLLAAQHQADTELATAKTALKAETAACADESTGTTTDDTDAGDATAACVAATQTLLADQKAVAADQQAVATAAAALSADLGSAAGAATPTNPNAADTVYGSRSTVVHAVAAVATTPAVASLVSPTGSTVTAATLAADQSAIDNDRASLATARADRDQATLRSPINGRVVAVTVAKGDRVSGTGNTGSPAVKILGSRQTKATTDVTAAQVRQLKTGMSATITPDGSSTPLAGTVVQLGQPVTSSSTGDTTYPVTITLSSHPTDLVSGAQAQVSIALSSLHNVVAVPTSAVHHSGSRAYVDVLSGSRISRRTVTVGAVGSDLTQVTSGLMVGQRVVIADLHAAVPSSSSNLLNNGAGGPNGFTFTKNNGDNGPTFSGPPPGAVIIKK